MPIMFRLDGPMPLHLLATVHGTFGDPAPLHAEVKSAIASSTRALFEVDLSAPPAWEFPRLKDGLLLTSVAGVGTVARARERGAPLGLDVSRIQSMYPAQVGMTLEIRTAMANGFRTQHELTYDVIVWKACKEEGLELGALETSGSQLAAIFGAPLAEQVEMLKHALKQKDLGFGTSTKRIVDCWQCGDFGGLESFVAEKLERWPHTFDALLSRRNAAWWPTLRSALNSAPSLAAVGALHLAGPSGLLALARQEGIAITRIL